MSECWRFNAMSATGSGTRRHEYLDMRRQAKGGMLLFPMKYDIIGIMGIMERGK